MKVYGIKNCDTVKKALQWLDKRGIEYEFHDFKKLGVTEDKLKAWSLLVGWERLVNKKGTTWKKLEPLEQEKVINDAAAFALMQEKTSVIKRPVVETSGKILVGFDEASYQELLAPANK